MKRINYIYGPTIALIWMMVIGAVIESFGAYYFHGTEIGDYLFAGAAAFFACVALSNVLHIVRQERKYN